MFHRKLFIALILLCVACASDDTEPEDKNSTQPKPQDKLDQTETPLPDGIPEKQDDIVNRGRAGVIETVVDAQSEDDWRKLDLDTGEQSDDEKAWDLSFSRSRILINGGKPSMLSKTYQPTTNSMAKKPTAPVTKATRMLCPITRSTRRATIGSYTTS
jgi:hypothetical protein